MKTIYFLLTIPIYLLLINLNFTYQPIEINHSNSQGTEVNLKVQDSVQVTIIRHRWYGTISDKLYLFKLIPIPIDKKSKTIHLIYLIILLDVIISNEIIKLTKNSKIEKYLNK